MLTGQTGGGLGRRDEILDSFSEHNIYSPPKTTPPHLWLVARLAPEKHLSGVVGFSGLLHC